MSLGLPPQRCIGTLRAVLAFGTSDALGGAYGIAVLMLMAITTVLAALAALHWGYNLFLVLAVNGLFLVVDLIFVAANATKLFEGGWFPLLLACAVAFHIARIVDQIRAAGHEVHHEDLARSHP